VIDLCAIEWPVRPENLPLCPTQIRIIDGSTDAAMTDRIILKREDNDFDSRDISVDTYASLFHTK
jgi:hypothetical protein